jgi:signal transduction histidine kinase
MLSAVLTKLEHSWRLSDWLPEALTIGLGLAPADPDYADRLRTAQIAAIVRLTPLTMGASCLNASILLVTLGCMGPVSPGLGIWASLVFATAIYYAQNWLLDKRRQLRRRGTRKGIRRAVIHAGLFGGLWGAVPVLTFPGAPAPTQLLVGCLTAGMMCAGGFVLATVPLAGIVYVLLVAAGALFALLQEASPVYVGLSALLTVYTSVVIVNLNWNAFLFVGHFLAEAQIQKEIAAREAAQAQAARSDRMIALGELAGGIAHDVNNVLQGIGGQADFIERHCAEPDEVRRLARAILTAVERAGAISRRLLAFARRDTLTSEPLDPAALLQGVYELLNHSLGPGITLDVGLQQPSGRCSRTERSWRPFC